MRRALRVVAVALVGAALAAGCKPEAKPAEPAEPAPPPAPARAAIEVLLPGGQVTARLEPMPDGYVLHDVAGWPIGRARIDGDSVRMEGRTGEPLCTASTSEAGFTLDDGGPKPRLVGVENGAGVQISSPEGVVAVLTSGRLQAGGHTLATTPAGDRLFVSVDGEPVLALRGFSHEGGVWLAWTELTFPERVAMMLLHAERL